MQHEDETGRGSAGDKYQGQGREAGVQQGEDQRTQWLPGGYPGIGFVEGRGPRPLTDEQRGNGDAQRASRRRTKENPAVRSEIEPWPGAAAWTWIDRACWPAEGDWHGEPDKVVWKDAASGFDMMARRSEVSGSWCGYVGVPVGHWAHGKGYSDVDQYFYDKDEDPGSHGGLTYAQPCMDAQEGCDADKMICHPTDAHGPEDKVWWLGFDCAHCDDLSPMLETWMGGALGLPRHEYRTLPYVRDCCEALARSLKNAA